MLSSHKPRPGGVFECRNGGSKQGRRRHDRRRWATDEQEVATAGGTVAEGKCCGLRFAWLRGSEPERMEHVVECGVDVAGGGLDSGGRWTAMWARMTCDRDQGAEEAKPDLDQHHPEPRARGREAVSTAGADALNDALGPEFPQIVAEL